MTQRETNRLARIFAVIVILTALFWGAIGFVMIHFVTKWW